MPRSPGKLSGTKWILVATGDFHDVPASTPFTLDIHEGTASGNGPCNQYHLPFTHDGEDVTTGPVASTRVACEPKLHTAEQRYFTKLEKVDTARTEGTEDQLVLSGPDDVRLVYDRADKDASDLEGEWNITNYPAAEALATPVKGTSPSLQFESDGTLQIRTGCNTSSSTWTADGHSLQISEPRSTLKHCSTPLGVDEQELRILDALPRVATAEVGTNDAVLLDDGGRALFVLKEK